MGIGQVMGFSAGWIAGAIISGAYFGDKISPLSDTTVVASSACGVDLFAHMRYLMLSSVPALLLALVVFAVKGFMSDAADADQGMMLSISLLGRLLFRLLRLRLLRSEFRPS